MLRRFQTRCAPFTEACPPARWRLDPRDVRLLHRMEDATLAVVAAGYSPPQTRAAIVKCLRGRAISLEGMSPGLRRALPRLLDAIRDAATAQLDAELIASVCCDAMEVGQLLRGAYREGLCAGKRAAGEHPPLQ